MLRSQARRFFKRHGAAAVDVRLVDLGPGEAEFPEHVEGHVIELLLAEAEHVGAELTAERPLVEHELDVERGRQLLLDGTELRRREALGFQSVVIDAWRILQRAVADRIVDDAFDGGIVIAEHAQWLRVPPC